MWGDVNGDGRPELLYNINGFLGYATWDPSEPDQPWAFHPVSEKRGYGQYQHGIGFGDLDGSVKLWEYEIP